MDRKKSPNSRCVRGRNAQKSGYPIFCHPDCHRRYRNFTGSAEHAETHAPFADFTAGKDFHLAPKINCWYYSITKAKMCQDRKTLLHGEKRVGTGEGKRRLGMKLFSSAEIRRLEELAEQYAAFRQARLQACRFEPLA